MSKTTCDWSTVLKPYDIVKNINSLPENFHIVQYVEYRDGYGLWFRAFPVTMVDDCLVCNAGTKRFHFDGSWELWHSPVWKVVGTAKVEHQLSFKIVGNLDSKSEYGDSRIW